MSEENLKLAREAMDAWNRGDLEAMVAKSTADSEFVPAVAAAVEGGESVRGHDEFRRFFANLNQTWESFRIEADEFRELENRILITGRIRAKGRGSGIDLDQPLTIVIWFREGKVERMHTFLDHEEALKAASQGVRT